MKGGEKKMGVAYAPKGLFGLLTPQANTTVEPEIRILTPNGFNYLSARLTSSKPSMNDRLIDYITQIDATLNQFANAPLQASAFACTGASYLIGHEKEAELCQTVEQNRNYPLITCGNAIAEALAALSAVQIGLVSPYGTQLTKYALEYWKSRGFNVAKLVDITSDNNTFHPIYALDSNQAAASLEPFSHANVDAVILLGTGLPSLPALAGHKLSIPVLSSNLCMMWRTIQSLRAMPADKASLEPWLKRSCWHLPV